MAEKLPVIIDNRGENAVKQVVIENPVLNSAVEEILWQRMKMGAQVA